MVKVAILHEGKTDQTFLELLITELELPINTIQWFSMKGKGSFLKPEHKNYETLKMNIDAEQIQRFLLVVDADYPIHDQRMGGYEKTEQAIVEMLQTLNLQSYADLYICCDPSTQQGNLESLILSTIPEKHKNCIKDFLACSEFKSKENHKAILNQIYHLAYPTAPYNLKHPHFNPLKQKLKKLFNK